MKETWKEVPGFPGYEVSNRGQVRSYFRRAGLAKWEIAESPQRILCPSLSQGSRGYRSVNLRKNGKTHCRRIGCLVLLAFVGLPSDGMEMCHNDGDSFNDWLDNLRYDTHDANMQDASRHGVVLGGGKPKLDSGKVYIIRVKFASSKYSRTELAKRYQVSKRVIHDVLTGRRAYKGGPGPIQKPCKRLTDRQAEAIRKQRVSGKSLVALAEKYGVSESAISRIASGKRHSNAGGPHVQPWEMYVAA